MIIALGWLLFCAILFLIFISLAQGGEVYRASRKVKHMSTSFDTLAADVKAAVANVSALTASVSALNATVTEQTAQIEKLKAEAGTTDAQLDALDAELKAALPPVPVPAEAPPAA